MEKFTASSGLVITPHRDGSVRWEAGFSPTVVTAALREFFLHERDQELGRWRWPENPDYVVSLSEGGESVWVLNERENGMISFTREMSTPVGEEEAGYSGAAWAYFAAHPEPKPWMEVPEGIYAVSPGVHPYERLLQLRNGEWLHLYRSADEGDGEAHTAEFCARVAYDEGRLTRLVAEVSDD